MNINSNNVCVGLDSSHYTIKDGIRRTFGVDIVKHTIDYADAYKMNMAYYFMDGQR